MRKSVVCDAASTNSVPRATLCVVAGFATETEARRFLRLVTSDRAVQRAGRSAMPIRKLLQKLGAAQHIWESTHKQLFVSF
jgi:hypothetical protein